MKKKERFKKDMKASTVIEMSYIMPVFLFLFLLIMYTVFYYHDKAVLNAAASETAVLGTQAARRADTVYDLETFFYERTKGKLIYMTDVSVTVSESEDGVEVSASADRNIMKLEICQRAETVRPEEALRRTGVILQ